MDELQRKTMFGMSLEAIENTYHAMIKIHPENADYLKAIRDTRIRQIEEQYSLKVQQKN